MYIFLSILDFHIGPLILFDLLEIFERYGHKTISNSRPLLLWIVIRLIPFVSFIEQPWNVSPRLDSTISVIYLGLVSTGLAWLLRFRVLVNNGLIFQSQVSYLIPIFGTILGYIFLKELITTKVLVSLIAVCIGIYFVKKGGNQKII